MNSNWNNNNNNKRNATHHSFQIGWGECEVGRKFRSSYFCHTCSLFVCVWTVCECACALGEFNVYQWIHGDHRDLYCLNDVDDMVSIIASPLPLLWRFRLPFGTNEWSVWRTESPCTHPLATIRIMAHTTRISGSPIVFYVIFVNVLLLLLLLLSICIYGGDSGWILEYIIVDTYTYRLGVSACVCKYFWVDVWRTSIDASKGVRIYWLPHTLFPLSHPISIRSPSPPPSSPPLPFEQLNVSMWVSVMM